MEKVIGILIVLILLPIGSLRAAEKTIGVIMSSDIPYYNTLHQALVSELEAKGLGSSKVNFQVQKPEPASMAWINAARKNITLEVDMIVTYGAPSTLSAVAETSKIPVIFAAVFNPADLGIKAKNTTGISMKIPLAGLIKNLKSIAPFSKLCVVYSEAEKDTVKQAAEVEKLEGQFGFKTIKYDLKQPSQEVTLPQADALFITTSSAAMRHIDGIVKAARAAKIPTAAAIGGVEESGILLTLCAAPQAQGKEAAGIVAEVINGSKPSSIPVKESGKVEMIVNVREAKALGLNVPFDLLMSATKVIK